jgi:ribosomal protein S18 acetylase RimI-like enzyme
MISMMMMRRDELPGGSYLWLEDPISQTNIHRYMMNAFHLLCIATGLSFHVTQALSASYPSTIVTQVETLHDWLDLADIRYDEWILAEQGNSKPVSTSRQAFRAATLDIYRQERPLSTLFLAKQETAVVGAAELSPYELHGVTPFDALYVTDVVTKRDYRRQGIARNMMKCIEDHASSIHPSVIRLILNVKHDNLAAIQFYQQLGYSSPSEESMNQWDPQKLNENAGTHGQMVMEKCLFEAS